MFCNYKCCKDVEVAGIQDMNVMRRGEAKRLSLLSEFVEKFRIEKIRIGTK
jgi:hypothetical protein